MCHNEKHWDPGCVFQVGMDTSCTSISARHWKLCYWIILGSFWQSGLRRSSESSLLMSRGRWANSHNSSLNLCLVSYFKCQCRKYAAREVKRKKMLVLSHTAAIWEICLRSSCHLKCCTGSDWYVDNLPIFYLFLNISFTTPRLFSTFP